jgi:hypothetical protein
MFVKRLHQKHETEKCVVALPLARALPKVLRLSAYLMHSSMHTRERRTHMAQI